MLQSIAIGLIPAVMWGIAPPLMTKYAKGGAYIQMLGTMTGVFLISVLLVLTHGFKAMSVADSLLAVASGAMWPIGMYGQFAANMKIGVSRTFPVSAGLQIAGNALIGWIVLGEWSTVQQIGMGLCGVLLILAGIMLGNVAPQKQKKAAPGELAALILLAATTVGYWLYALLPKYIPDTDAYSTQLLQAAGMILSAVLITRFCGKRKLTDIHVGELGCASVIGLLYGIASFAYLISLRENGLVRGNLLGQLNLVIATLIGMYILKEKQPVSKARSWLGMVLILAGVAVIQI